MGAPDYTLLYGRLAEHYGEPPSTTLKRYADDPWSLGYDLYTLQYMRRVEELSRPPSKDENLGTHIDRLYMQAQGR